MNIVIVDDDRLVSEALKTILEVNGDVRIAAIGRTLMSGPTAAQPANLSWSQRRWLPARLCTLDILKGATWWQI